jgi:two-component system chemotaxis sensor kinase CheA
MRGGLSTSRDVTEESGRGVGLDVVQDAVTQLGGHVTVQTDTGKGTTFQLIVPRSLASMEALVVEASGTVALIPLDSVRLSMRVAADDLTPSSTGLSVLYEQTAIPFIPLCRMIGDARPAADRSWTVVVIAGAGRCVAIGVDRIVEAARVVMHPLPDHTPASAIVGGAMLDAEGNPQLVLDPEGLAAEAARGKLREADMTADARSILVVDDSLTTRMLEQSILESAGYTVSLAISGEEALDFLRRERYALVLTDVEMPGMDGFMLIEHMRAGVTTRDTPAILVTSLDSSAFRQRGADAGAQGYIVKSEFDQAKLLAMIRSHTG